MAQTAFRPGALDTGTVHLSSGSVSFPIILASLPGRNGLDFDLSAQYSSMGIRKTVTTWTQDAPTGLLGLGWSFPQEQIVRIWNGSTQDSTYGLLTENTLYALVKGGADAAGEIYETTSYQFWKIRYQPERELWTITREDGTCSFYGGNVQAAQGNTNTSMGDSIEWGVRWGTWTGPSNVAEKQEQFPVAWNLTFRENIWGDRVAFLYEQDQQLVGKTVGAGPIRKKYTQACRLSQVIGATGESMLLHYGPEEGAENRYETRVKEHTSSDGGPDAYQDRLERHFLDSLEVLNANGDLVSHVQLRYASLGSGEMQKQVLKSMTFSNNQGNLYEPPRLFAYYGETPVDGVSVSKTDASHVAHGNALFGALKSMTAPQGAITSYQYTELAIPHALRDLPIPRPGNKWQHPLTYLGLDYAVVIWRGTDDKEHQIHVSAYQWLGQWVPTILPELTVGDAKDIQVEIAPTFFAIITPGQTQAVHLFHKRPYSHGEWSYFPQNAGTLTDCLIASGDDFLVILDRSNGKLSCFTYNANNWQSSPVFDTPLKMGKDTVFALTAQQNSFCTVSAVPGTLDRPEFFRPELRLYSLDAFGKWHARTPYTSEHFVPAEFFNTFKQLSLESSTTFISLLLEGDKKLTWGGDASLLYQQLFVFPWSETTLTAEPLPIPATFDVHYDEDRTQLAMVGDMVVLSSANAGKIVYQYTGAGWLSKVFENDSQQNNYLGPNSFSTTDNGKAQYWEFDPNTGQWETGKIPPYEDGNPTLWEKFWSIIWPAFSFTVGILTLPLSFGTGLLIDLALLPFDLYALLLTPGSGNGGHSSERFFTGDNRVYHQDATGTWSQIGELLTEAEKAEKPVPGEGTTFETQKLQFQNTQAASTFIAYAITQDRKKILAGAPGGVRPAGYPKYISKIQLLKNGAFLSSATTLPEQEALQRSPDDETSLVGWNAFLTFQEGKTLKEATSLKLHRVIQDGFQGALKAYVVSRVSVHDGYEETHIHYDYETESAAYSPVGTTALYNRVTTIYSGSSPTPTRSNGYTESYFYVGDTTSLPNQPADQTSTNSADYPALVAGRLYATRVFDGAGHQVAATTYSWFVYQRSLLGRGAGCFLRQVKEERENDGCKKVVETDYSIRDFDGFPGGTTVSNYDVTGHKEEIKTSYRYGVDLYPQLKERHILEPIVQTITSVNGIETSNQATTWLPTRRNLFRLTPGQELPPQFQGAGWSATDMNSVSVNVARPGLGSMETRWEAEIPSLTLIPPFSGRLLFTYNCDVTVDGGLTWADLEVLVDGSKVWGISKTNAPISEEITIDLSRNNQRVECVTNCGVQVELDEPGSRHLEHHARVRVSVHDIRMQDLQLLAPAVTYQAKKPQGLTRPGDAPLDWLTTSEVAARHPLYGLVTETQDVDAITSSIIYDTNYQFSVARFAHASVEKHEAGYYGFEDYENAQLWQLTGVPEETGDTHSGQKAYAGSSVRIEPRTFTPRAAATLYIVSAWVKPRHGGSGSQIGFGSAGKQIAPHSDDWQYVEFVTDTPRADQKPFASCDGAIDDFRFSPVDAPFSAIVYDPTYHLVTEQLGTNGETIRSLYDDLQTLIATTGPDGQEISHLMIETHSREGEKPFNAARPNQKLSILPRNGGRYYRTLVEYIPDLSGSISPGMSKTAFFGQAVPPPTANYGLKWRVSVARNSGSSFSITFGEGSVRCDDGRTIKLTSPASGHAVPRSFTPGYNPLDEAEWMLIVLGQQAFFFLDGDFLFCERLSQSPSVLAFHWDSVNPLIFPVNHVFVFSDPIVELQYTDGLDRVIQTVHLDQHAEGTVASQILYDGWGHPAVTTKPLSISQISLAYQSNLVKTFDWSSGKMTGEVVDYYTRVQAPDQKQYDALYPYNRQVAEANPLARIYEITQPGVDFQVGSLQIAQMQFGRTSEANALLADLGLTDKASYYTALTTHHPFDGHTRSVTTRLFDLRGNLIALRHGQGTTAQTSLRSVTYASNGTSTTISTQPNAFPSWKEQAKQQYRTTTTRDFLGRIQVETDSDCNTEQFIYDRAGRLRFKLDAEGAMQNPHRILYWRYDALGRILEEGLLHQKWDREQLQSEADGPLPGKDTGATWTKRYVYDIDGRWDLPHFKGRLVEVVTRGDGIVRESFAYDLAGNLVETTLSVEAFETPIKGTPIVTSYEYDRLNQVTRIIYPHDASQIADVAVQHFYHNSGQLASIGTADDPTRYAAYEYNLDGSIKTEKLNKQRLQYDHTYDFQGHVRSLKNQQGIFSEELQYRDANGIFKDGNVVSATFTGKAVSRPHAYTYQYDRYGRLTAAQTVAAKAGMMPHPDWDLREAEYDANGNLLNLQQGEASATYTYTQGTNQLEGLQHHPAGQYPPTGLEAYEHNANGWITKSGEINAVHYDPQTALPLDIRTRRQRILLLYGGRGQRVVKTTITSPQEQRVYVHGANAYPLVEYTQKGRTCYIYGPGGLLAQSEDARTFAFFLKDHLGSTRVVLNEENKSLAAFRYLPFGSVTPENGYSREALLRFRYLFTGQEYDEGIGLHNYRARMYDSNLGRFLTPDPKRQFPSPYVYVNNNPVNLIDPTGELGELAAAFRTAFVGVVRGTRRLRTAVRGRSDFTHDYDVETVIGTASEHLTVDSVFDLMRKRRDFATPQWPWAKTATINLTDNPITSIPILGRVKHTVNPEMHTLTNTTLPDHLLHSGTVTHTLSQKGTTISLHTHGIGEGFFPEMNEALASMIWGGPHEKLIKAVEKDVIEKKAKAIARIVSE